MSFLEVVDETDQRMSDPQTGDLFHEMYSFWVWVEKRDGDKVITHEKVGSIWRQIIHETVADFQKAYAYGSIPGYSVMYYGNRDLRKARL